MSVSLKLPARPEIIEAARRIVWFEEPEQAMADPYRFMAYALTYGGWDDVRMLLRAVGGKEVLPDLLDNAPPGIMDERSWVLWNIAAGRTETPPMPKRQLGEQEEEISGHQHWMDCKIEEAIAEIDGGAQLVPHEEVNARSERRISGTTSGTADITCE